MIVWRIVFGLAAAFNLAVGFAIMTDPASLGTQPFTGTAQEALFIKSCGWLIAVFGLGYLMVAIAPLANRGIALLGVIGKAAMPVFAYPLYSSGVIPFESYALTLGDLVFVALFAWFLVATRVR
jgi:hypothetical protein